VRPALRRALAAVGHISGAHFWSRAIAYWCAQLLGALVALLRGSLGKIAHVGATVKEDAA
jgi:hypothetical protein